MITKDKYIKALLAVRDKGLLRSSKYLEMLRAHHKYLNQTITAGKLAEEIGYKDKDILILKDGDRTVL